MMISVIMLSLTDGDDDDKCISALKASASSVEDSGFDSCMWRGDFSGSGHTSDFKIGTPVATLSGAQRYRVSAGTSWPGVSIL